MDFSIILHIQLWKRKKYLLTASASASAPTQKGPLPALPLPLLHHCCFRPVRSASTTSVNAVASLVWQQLCCQVAALATALVVAWLLSSSSMLWKFNSNHYTFLKIENPSSGSKNRQHFWQQLCYQVAAVTAVLVTDWLPSDLHPGRQILASNFNISLNIFIKRVMKI